MDITEVSMLHHVAIVLFLLGFLSFFNRCHPLAFFLSFLYLYLVHETIVLRLRRKVRFEERKQANQKRVLSDSETVRWLNHAVEKIWPICMEQIASQKILLPIIPWFLEKYKPWTAKKALVQHLYLGRSPPHFTEMRVLQNTSNDDHLVLELGMNFRTADDMSAILAIKLTRRLGFGMWAKMHMTGMHVEGKVLIGVKFIRGWPFISRLRVCFAEPPYFQMTVKPIFSHGLDVTVLPGIAGWLDKLLSVAFEQSLVQPNMLVVDMEKFVEPEQGNWFTVDEKAQIASVLVEVIKASDIKPSDFNGLADPYVKGQLGPYSFRSKVQRKTLTPKWVEEFRIPICTWDSPNVLAIEVRDKDCFVDDNLGVCTVNVNELRDGERHDMWLSLQNIKMGRLHIAITVNEKQQGDDNPCKNPCKNPFENSDKEDIQDTYASNTANRGSFSSNFSEKSHKVADNFEPIKIEGQQETGIWIHHPGSEVSPKWEPRKGKSRNLDAEVRRVPSDLSGNTYSAASGSNSSSSSDENTRGGNRMRKIRRGLRRVSAVFHRHHKNEDQSGNYGKDVQSAYANIRALNRKDTGVKFMVDESDFQQPDSGKDLKPVCLSPSGTSAESPNKETKAATRSIFKHAGNPGGSIKKVLSRKGSKSSQDGSSSLERETDVHPEYDSSDEFISSPQTQWVPVVVSNLISSSCSNEASPRNRENIVPTFSGQPTEGQIKAVNAECPERIDESKVNSEQRSGAEDTTSSSL